jgi:cephalosporin-C deacetylase-like acetyl esterase
MKTSLLLCICLFFTSATAQKQYKVFDWKSEQTLNTWLLQMVHTQYKERKKNFDQSLTSPTAFYSYRDACLKRYKTLLGAFPEKTSLNAKITGTIHGKGYRIEKIVYESLPKHAVTSNLYIPEGKGPFPAVILFCGHENEGKATESYQKTAILFALNGFVVFVIDPVSQSERHQLLDPSGKPKTRGGTTEHTLMNAAANMVGSSTVMYELWDNIRGLDYLTSRPEVDAQRIGSAGNSGGGTQVTYLIGLDDRIKIAAPCSSVSSRERNLELAGPNDGCQHIPSEGNARLEIVDFLLMFAPKPLLILAGRYDFVDYEGTEKTTDELKRAYELLGRKDQVELFTADDGHGISAPKREAVVKWFKRWMNVQTPYNKENNLQTLSVDQLMCTIGQVHEMPAYGFNDFDRAKQKAEASTENRVRQSNNLSSAIRTVTGILREKASVSVEEMGWVSEKGVSFQKVILRRPGSPPLPALITLPDRADSVILWLHEKGKHTIADSSQLIRQYHRKKCAVVLADLSGIGETADPLAFNDPKYYNSEYRNAMLALHIGKSLPALRITDILSLIEFIDTDKRLSTKPINVYATGKTALPALHAAVLEPRINQINLSGFPSSFYEAFSNPERRDWYSYVIPDVLNYYDLPDLQKVLGKRLKIF